MRESTAYLRIGFEEAATFFWDIEGPERIRSNTSRGHAKMNIKKKGEDFEIEATFKEAIAKDSVLGMQGKVLQSEFSSRMRLLRIDEKTIFIVTEPTEKSGRIVKSKASLEPSSNYIAL